jgi:hypothetical protein
MTDPRTKILDSLGAAHSFIHTIKRLAENVCNGEGEDYCALMLMADSAINEICEAQIAFDDVEISVNEHELRRGLTPSGPVDKSNNGGN